MYRPVLFPQEALGDCMHAWMRRGTVGCKAPDAPLVRPDAVTDWDGGRILVGTVILTDGWDNLGGYKVRRRSVGMLLILGG